MPIFKEYDLISLHYRRDIFIGNMSQEMNRCNNTITKQVRVTVINGLAPTIAGLRTAPNEMPIILSSGSFIPKERRPETLISSSAIKN